MDNGSVDRNTPPRRLRRVAAAAALALAFGAVPASGATASQRPVAQAPGSIPADCSVDVTRQLNVWIASVPDQSTLSFPKDGCFRIEKTVKIKNRHGLTLEGNGSTFRAFTDGTGYVADVQTRNHFYLWGGGDLVVRNLTVQGVNTDHRYHEKYAGQRGFRIAGVQGALLENIRVTEVRGDFVEVDPDYFQTWRWSSDITIRNSVFTHSGRQGLTVTGGRRVLFQHNHIAGAALSVFDIEPDSGTSKDAEGYPTYGGAADIRILDNEVGPGSVLFFGNVVPFKDVVTKNIEISRNRLRGIALSVWAEGHRDLHYRNYTITDNTSDTVYAGPRGSIELRYVDGALVSGNTQRFHPESEFWSAGVKSWGSSDVVVVDNRFPDADVVLQVDKARFGSPWNGDAGGRHLACGNRFGFHAARLDAVCSD